MEAHVLGGFAAVALGSCLAQRHCDKPSRLSVHSPIGSTTQPLSFFDLRPLSPPRLSTHVGMALSLHNGSLSLSSWFMSAHHSATLLFRLDLYNKRHAFERSERSLTASSRAFA